MAGRVYNTAGPDRGAPARGVTTLGVDRMATQATPPPTSGPTARSQNAMTYPPSGNATPVTASASARPREWPAMNQPIAPPRRAVGTFSATSMIPVVYVPPSVRARTVYKTRPDQ